MLSRSVSRIALRQSSKAVSVVLSKAPMAVRSMSAVAVVPVSVKKMSTYAFETPAVVSAAHSHREESHRQRQDHSSSDEGSSSSSSGFDFRGLFSGATLLAASAGVWVIDGEDPAYQAKIRAIEPKVRAAIEEVLDGGDFDGHGSYGPIFIRLAWHASGTYDKESNTGGSNGSTMRFDPESKWGANNGLQAARDRLESVKQQFPEISYADLWTLAAVVAIEAAGGPAIVWRPGRSDAEPRGVRALPDGRLPDAAQGARHVREIFYRMGFNDREITALIGAHAMGKTHTANSGYEGPWTRAPTTFSNQFYVLLKEEKWRIRDWRGPKQYENDGKDLMMLPADMAFLWDSEFRKYTDLYAKDEEAFFKDFAAAYGKLLELGVPAFQKGDKKQ